MATKKTPDKKTKPGGKAVPAKKAPAAAKRKAAPVKKPAAPKRGRGRPTSYRPEYAEQAYKFALLGATDVRMADLFGVSEQTFNAWKKAHPNFLESLTQGKEKADAEIAAALFHRARGYSHPEEDIRTVAAGGGGGSEIVITPTVKHYPPDTAAATLWLKNRQPTIWRDKVEMEHAGKDGGPIETRELSDAERAVRLANLLALAAARAKAQ